MKTFVCLSLIGFFSIAADAVPNRPVQVGGSLDYDACGGSGVILATTTLFTVNSVGQIKFEKVELNQSAASCDSEENGEFIGIVFGKPGQDCRVGSPIRDRAPYSGPCKSGWVKKSFFELLAG